jgi:aminopeptidase N
VLREPSLDPAFKALALTLPSEAWIAEQIASVDPQRVHAAREAMKRQLAVALVDDWQWAFDAHQVKGGYSPDPVSAGRRALANVALIAERVTYSHCELSETQADAVVEEGRLLVPAGVR